MTIGQPALVVPRTVSGQIDQRALADFCKNVALRIAAIEASLKISSTETLQAQLQGLLSQPDGLVYKSAGQLFTCLLAAGSGINIQAGSDANGANPRISIPLLKDLADQPDGLVTIASGGPLATRILAVASGTGITIVNDDGAGGDPTFHIP